MAAHVPHSHSPQMSERAVPQTLAQRAPLTPVHSPHHSLTSLVSSRTPIHTLSIHEYRKLQNTPGSQTVTPSGKTLRRKAAAPALHGLERAPSVARLSKPLHLSQSAQHLPSRRSPFAQHPLPDQLFRSQSAEPRTQGGSVSSITTTTSTGKVRHFNSRKRLPKPPAAAGNAPFPPRFADATIAPSRRLHRPATLEIFTESSRSSDTRTPHTASTFSLSRFPHPPHFVDLSSAPQQNESELTRLNALSFASTARSPATPPATPVIQFGGTSFNLVNPHDSLLLHDIVTPSRDFGSSEYLVVPDDEMAPKRALYGDFTAAHAGILRRADDSFSSSNLELPLPPTPAAISPDSSSYASPIYSPHSNFAPPPLALSKAPTDSRFSLKQLTRTLTKRLGRSPEKHHGQELQTLYQGSHVASTSADFHAQPARNRSAVATPQSAYFPLSPASPITPVSPMSHRDYDSGQGEEEDTEDDEVELPRRHVLPRHDSEPLASWVPEDNSTQIGRVDDPRASMSEGHLLSRPYYDDLDSIYPSSSVYTGEDRRISDYQQSLASARQSNPFLRYSGMDSSSFANDYNQDSLYGYSVRNRRKSKPLSQEMYHRMANQEKTDTIGKIIDQYDPNTISDNTLSMQSQETIDESPLFRTVSGTANQPLQTTRSGLSQFEFEVHHGDVASVEPMLVRRPTIVRNMGDPPREPAPLAPPFQYDEAPFVLPQPDTSETFTYRSSNSYGDTRNLLQFQTSQVRESQTLQPSSSYSQVDANPVERSSSYSQTGEPTSPQTPQEALDQAEQIFESAQRGEKGIPAMWARRSSGSMLVGKKSNAQATRNSQHSDSLAASQSLFADETEADWESEVGNNRAVRDSYGSIADYSSSEGTRNSLGLDSNGSLPSWQNHSQGPSVYSHPSPLRAHHNPFSSSPPQLRQDGRGHLARESSDTPFGSSPPGSRVAPVSHPVIQPEDAVRQGAVEQPYNHAPWADRYAFSDKETQELLASGPNDKIIFDNKHEQGRSDEHEFNTPQHQRGDMMFTSSSPLSIFGGAGGLERENTFEKLCIIGPKGNLTGTPQGTGMHETGSSVADTSSPGLALTSSARESFRSSEYDGFYAAPFPATGSVTRIQQSGSHRVPEHERTPSQDTLFPRRSELEPVTETSPKIGASHRTSLRSSTTFQRSHRRVSRTAAVPGQTKLRQMILAPEVARKTLSSADTNFSHFKADSGRPSTSDTNTPLRTRLSVPTLPIPIGRTLIAHQHSPHLLCPERAANSVDEERRRKLSWAILAVFCLLPPCIILFRVWGDSIMISLTKGGLGHCTNKSKRVALIAAVTLNIGLATAIVVPIVVAHALGAA